MLLIFLFFSKLPRGNRAVLRSNPPRGDVSPHTRCRRQRKKLTPGIQPREHQKVTPHPARIATPPGHHHGADRRHDRDQEGRLTGRDRGSESGMESARGQGQGKTGSDRRQLPDRMARRSSPGSGNPNQRLKEKFSGPKSPPEPEYLPGPHPLPDRGPSPPWKANDGY